MMSAVIIVLPRCAGDVPDGMGRARRSIMRRVSSFSFLLGLVTFAIGAAIAYGAYSGPASAVVSGAILVVAFLLALFVGNAIRVADAWDRAVVLRLGRFRALR